jgi:ubiquinone/menaquinone biosynthesis C-methylase UbiE
MTPDYLARPIGFVAPDFADAAYDELSFWGSRFGALLFEHLELRPDVRGLDVACGAGFPLFELAHVHGPASHFTGIDKWEEAITRARRKLAWYGLTNVALHSGDAAAMPFESGSFDLITSNLGINNFADPGAVLRECHRLARRGARLVVTTNVTGHMAAFYDVFRAVAPEHSEAITRQEEHRGSRGGVERLIADAGFEVTKIVEDEFFLRFASGSAMFRHPLVRFFLDSWRGVVDEPEVYEEIERRLNDVSPLRMRIPMLYAEGVRR